MTFQTRSATVALGALAIGRLAIRHLALGDAGVRSLKLKELDSYRDGEARRITVASIRAYAARKLAAAETFERARHPGQKRIVDDSPAPT